MTSDLGFPIVMLILIDIVMDIMHPSLKALIGTVAFYMHITLISTVFSQWGLFRWNCMFCGKPSSGSLIKMITEVCNHEG